MTAPSNFRRELGQFLQARRRALPATSQGRRRTPGLRREEVAALSNISVDYYTRLEQGRAASMPSVTVLAALEQALSLTAAERDHLHRLTGRSAPESTEAEEVAPSLAFLVQAMSETPAQVVSDLGDVLDQNTAADEAFPWVKAQGLGRANVFEFWFLNDTARSIFPAADRDAYSEAQAGEIRTAATRRALIGDTRGDDLVASLQSRSEEFIRAWDAGHAHDGRDKVIWIPNGDTNIACLAHVTIDVKTNQRLIAFEQIGLSDAPEGSARMGMAPAISAS